MGRTLAAELTHAVGGRATLQGWLHHQRQLAHVTFVLVRDRSGIAQVVVTDPVRRAEAARLPPETVIEVSGTVVANDQAPSGVEIHAPDITVISRPAEPPPFELRRPQLSAQLPVLLDHAAVALRHPRRRAVAAIAAASVRGFRSALEARGFTEIFTPKVVATATESGANVFPVDWFGERAYLAQSPQFYKQTMVGVLERVFEVAPVFRAESHDTARHLAQYVSLDVEMGFIRDHRDVMAVLQEVIVEMLAAIGDHAGPSLRLLGLAMPEVGSEIPAVDFESALELIEASTGEPAVGEPDLSPGHERWLGQWARSEHGSDFLFVTGYPMVKRPFYTHPHPERPHVSNSFDLLFRGVELVTGGQRLHRYDDYVAALGSGTDIGPYDGYLAAFRHGMPPHGGFAIGLERWVARLTGARNIREVTLFPRDLNRLTP